jgi:hypothetical protein
VVAGVGDGGRFRRLEANGFGSAGQEDHGGEAELPGPSSEHGEARNGGGDRLLLARVSALAQNRTRERGCEGPRVIGRRRRAFIGHRGRWGRSWPAGGSGGRPCATELLGTAGETMAFCRKPPVGWLGRGGLAAGPLGPFGQGEKGERRWAAPREREREGFSLFFFFLFF